VLPGGVAALVAERATGRILRVERGQPPVLVTTVPVEGTGGGGLTGLVLSPTFSEDQLVYAYASTAADNRVLRIAPGEPPKPVLAGIPRGAANNGGALAVDRGGALLVATGDAGSAPAPTSLAGKLLRIDTLGRPAPGNPDPASGVLSSGLHIPGGVCTDVLSGTLWITDRLPDRDVLYRAQPGALGAPAWSWPARPGAAGCVAGPGVVAIAQAGAALLYVLRPAPNGGFTGEPELLLTGVYGRLNAATRGPDGLVWLGTVNKGGGGAVVPSDDRVIRIQPPAGGGSKL
jgi:glucose/arabinose dehydrogenase